MKRKSKIFVTSFLSLAMAGVVATSCFITFRPKPIYPLYTYILEFTNTNTPYASTSDVNEIIKGNESKNKYIKDMIQQTRTILDWYESYYEKTYHEKFPGLILDFRNLNSVPSEGEKNFFLLLDRTFKAIDSRLGFNNIPRTPLSVQEGFFQKNTELISFYWSPDFNAITTWLTYMFTDQFPIGNQWPKLYRLLENPKENWQINLRKELDRKNLFHSPIELLNYSSKQKASSTDYIGQFYTSLSNTIGTWTVNNSKLNIQESTVSGDTKGLYDTTSNPGDGILFVNWITSQIANIPFVEDGINSSIPFLIRAGYFNPNNPNADYSFRDWYYNKSTVSGPAQFRLWNKSSPFDVNKTPFNPAFSNAPSSSFFQSAWTALTSWTTVSNYNNIRNPQTPIGSDHTYLVSTGSKTSIDDLKNSYDETTNTLTFRIRPIPWVDYTGNQINVNNQKMFLSPEDFTASIIAFIRSNQISLNANSYFIDLISLDVNKTINDSKNLERNESLNDTKEFVLHFKEKPELSIDSVLDILQKQYFCAIPAFKQSVKNIIDYDTFMSLLPNAVEITDKPNPYINGEYYLKVNSSQIDFYNFYGSGNPVLNSNSWKDYAFASPYYISSIDQQQIVFNLNESYFNAFKDELNDQKYKSFKLTNTISPNSQQPPNGNGNSEENIVAKIPKIVLKYAGSYSEILTFEQFKNNELDVSLISSAKLLEAKQSFPNDYRTQLIEKNNKSNLITFNLQVFSKNDKNIILDTNGDPIVRDNGNYEVVNYDIDEYGNYIFPEGVNPKLKSNISKPYYDLIVRDYYTPIEAYNPDKNIYATSATIRETIVNCINWVSLKSVVFPGITKSIENSFLPYGVYDLVDKNNPDYIKKYWWYAAYKTYMFNDLNILDVNTYEQRKSGLIIWTYDELLNNSIKNNNKGGN